LLWLCTKVAEHILEVIEHLADSGSFEQVGFVEAPYCKSLGPFTQGQDNIERGERNVGRDNALL